MQNLRGSQRKMGPSVNVMQDSKATVTLVPISMSVKMENTLVILTRLVVTLMVVLNVTKGRLGLLVSGLNVRKSAVVDLKQGTNKQSEQY